MGASLSAPPCLALPLMVHSMKLGPGLTLLGLSFPICKLGFLHTYREGRIQCKAPGSPSCCWSWFGGRASFLGPLLKGAWSSAHRASLPPEGLWRGAASPWNPVGLPWGLSSALTGWPSRALRGTWLMKAAPSRASGEAPWVCPHWCLREGERTQESAGKSGRGFHQ